MRHFPTLVIYHFLVCCFWLAAAVMSVKSFATLFFSFFVILLLETVFGRYHIVVIILIYHKFYIGTYIKRRRTHKHEKYIYSIGTIYLHKAYVLRI